MKVDFRLCLDSAERLVMQARTFQGDVDWLLLPSTICAWLSIETFVNGRIEDFKNIPGEMFSLHERAFLEEKLIQFVNSGAEAGEFKIKGERFVPIDQKILFLLRRVGADTSAIRGKAIWQDFEKFRRDRNRLAHPRPNETVELSIEKVEEYIETSRAIISHLGRAIWAQDIRF